MKKIIILIIVLLFVSTAVIAVARMSNFTNGFFEDLFSGNGGNGGSIKEPEEDEIELCTTFTMNELEHTYDYATLLESETCGVLFSATISQGMKAEAENANAILKMVYGPLTAFEQAAASEGFEGDWAAAFESAAASVVVTAFEAEHMEVLDNKCVLLRVWSENTLDDTANTKMTGIAYIEYADGTRTYAQFPQGETYASIAHSYLYVAILKGQNNSGMSDVIFTVANTAYQKALELAYGGEQTSFDLSTVIDTTPLTMKVGDTKQFPRSVEFNGVEVPVKWFWITTQQSVIRKGLLEIKEAQSGCAQGMLWAKSVKITVTVTETTSDSDPSVDPEPVVCGNCGENVTSDTCESCGAGKCSTCEAWFSDLAVHNDDEHTCPDCGEVNKSDYCSSCDLTKCIICDAWESGIEGHMEDYHLCGGCGQYAFFDGVCGECGWHYCENHGTWYEDVCGDCEEDGGAVSHGEQFEEGYMIKGQSGEIWQAIYNGIEEGDGSEYEGYFEYEVRIIFCAYCSETIYYYYNPYDVDGVYCDCGDLLYGMDE